MTILPEGVHLMSVEQESTASGQVVWSDLIIYKERVNNHRRRVGRPESDKVCMFVESWDGTQMVIVFEMPPNEFSVLTVLEWCQLEFDPNGIVECLYNPIRGVDFFVSVGFPASADECESIVQNIEANVNLN